MSALIWCPFPDEKAAEAAAMTLLDEQLIACANLLGPIRSLFEWQGERGEALEVGVLFKTDEALLDAAIARIAELHPYDTPAVLGWPAHAAPSTAAWLGGLTGAT